MADIGGSHQSGGEGHHGHGRGKNGGRQLEKLSKDLHAKEELRAQLTTDPETVLQKYGLGSLVESRAVRVKIDVGNAGEEAPGERPEAVPADLFEIFGIHVDFTGGHFDRADHFDLSKQHNDGSLHGDIPSFHGDATHTDIRPHVDF